MNAPSLAPDPEHLADACIAAARVNHYLVGIGLAVSRISASAAKQVLIRRENASTITEEEATLAFVVLCQACGVRSEAEL